MRTASQAYPQRSQQTYVRFIVVGAVGLFALFLFTSSVGNPSGYGDSSLRASNAAKSVRLSELLAVGLGLSGQAAEVIKEVKRQHTEDTVVKGKTAEGVDEPVTVADKSANEVFVNGYRNHFPGIPILSEETEPKVAPGVRSAQTSLPVSLKVDPLMDLSDVLIIFDPLDATKEFTEDLREYVTTMVCVVYKGTPIAGIINQVFEEDPPAWGVIPLEGQMEGVHGRVPQVAQGEAAQTVTMSMSHTGQGVSVVDKYFPEQKVLKAGGAGYKSLLVVDGKADAYIHVTKIKSWDVCAAEAVVKAMGGGFTNVDGQALEYGTTNPYFTRGIVATATKDKLDHYVQGLGGNLS